MSSLVIGSSQAHCGFEKHTNTKDAELELPLEGRDDDVEMSDGLEQPAIADANHAQGGEMLEILIKESHSLFSLNEIKECSERQEYILTFLNLLEENPDRALKLINEASQNFSHTQLFRDYILFNQMSIDMLRSRRSSNTSHSQASGISSKSSSTNSSSVIGSHSENLQWLFSFFGMHSVHFHHKNMTQIDNLESEDLVLLIREKADSDRLGNVMGVVIVQRDSLEIEQTEEYDTERITSIMNEFTCGPLPKTRLGVIINGSIFTVLTVDDDYKEEDKLKRVIITQEIFDICDSKDFSALLIILECFVNSCIGVKSAARYLLSDPLRTSETEDMESAPSPRSTMPFPEKDYFFIDKFNTVLCFHNIAQEANPALNERSGHRACVKKRSHFCNWERQVLNRLKTHPYIIKELDLGAGAKLIDASTTIIFDNVRPLNKRLFSLVPTDVQGNSIQTTQQLLNTRFEILRQFIKQALHSVVYCHSNNVVHRNLNSHGGTFFLDDQYRLKLMGFEHSAITEDAEARYKDMRDLSVVFAELMFDVQFDIKQGTEDDWAQVWDDIEYEMTKHDDIVHICPRHTMSDRLLYSVNMRTKKHMFNMLYEMFHTRDNDYYHTLMYHSFIGMASSVYKEKSKQKLKEKTVQLLNGNKSTILSTRKISEERSQRESILKKWTSKMSNVVLVACK